ncbi:MAG TPA: tRNA (adenosine(37)-N6)-threonylcarbamoyltransferase complex dimerization subunit type 1 TsaB [Terriglobales bacterium]|nr:tRNA (adenosine(37)-N6)-threonylcarbamoyltransferase complex dimerization subunit type 1 TsaB [Terriglobales bacterium]
MWALAIETTSTHGSVALLRGDALQRQIALSSPYSTGLFAAVEATLQQTGIRLSDIALFAVADGPGSFTGVRVGLAAVKGWVEVLQRPAVSVSTLRAVAAGAPGLAALDAGRGEVYFGSYAETGGQESGEEDEGEEGIESLEAFCRRAAAWQGPVLTPHAAIAAACPQARAVEPLLAANVGRLGLASWRRGKRWDALSLDARYLRRSDAEVPLGRK